jgi:hypothetical protein
MALKKELIALKNRSAPRLAVLLRSPESDEREDNKPPQDGSNRQSCGF